MGSWRSLSGVSSSYGRLFFRHADSMDVLLMLLGVLGAIVNGLSMPAMYLVQSHLFDKFGRLENGAAEHADASKQAVLCFYIALITFAGAYLEVSCWIHTGNRQARRLRLLYAASVLAQESAYFDCNASPAQIIDNVSTDLIHIQEAIGEKLANLVENMSLFAGSFIASLVLTWRMTLLILPFLLLLLLPGFFYARALSTYAMRRRESYAAAGKIVEQAISSIRLVYSLAAEQRTLELYSKLLQANVKVDRMQGFSKGLALGLQGLRYGVWSLMIWIGGKLVLRKHANGVQVLIAGTAFIAGSMALGSVIQNLKEVSEGHGALTRIFRVVDTKPSMDTGSKTLESVRGQLDFVNVAFAYPSRPGAMVLKDFSLHIPHAKTCALVGRSGCGKSTVIALLERFYDPICGDILVDGHNIKSLHLAWLRRHIGLVSQEPTLFSLSIKDNITLAKQSVTMDQIVAAAKKADAHSFIMGLPQRYETQVGARGAHLSGGQRQRIAIARAIVNNPAILLMDEATSALDDESHNAVEKALEQVCIGRTAVVITHRLVSTKNAHLVAVVENGKVVEFGTPKELLSEQPHGAYFQMLKLQQQSKTSEEGLLQAGLSNTSVLASQQQQQQQQQQQEKQPDKSKETKAPTLSFPRLLLMNKPEWKQCVLGVLAAACMGFLHPLFVAAGARAISSFYAAEEQSIRQTVNWNAGVFGGLAIVAMSSSLVQHYNFGSMGAKLTRRIREQMLAKILHFEVAWFDDRENSSGAVCSRLATNASMVRTLVGDRLSVLVQTGSTICIALIFSFILSWRLAVVIISIQPITLSCFYSRVTKLQKFAKRAAHTQEEVSQLIVEATSQHQTVTALCSEPQMMNMVRDKLKSLEHKAFVLSHTAGLTAGFALFVLLSSYALCIWYGGSLIAHGKCSFNHFLIIFYLLIGTGRSLADTLALSPDISQGMAVAESAFQILDRKTGVPSVQQEEDAEIVEGGIEFDEVCFAYPMRPGIMVLHNLSLNVQPSETVAIAGRSGSGKSTLLALLERFYEPHSGCIRIDGRDIKLMSVQSLRQQLGLVSQEPALFSLTIGENIAYGSSKASEAEIIEAARTANAHDFISALPEGYGTSVGDMGAQLSGGQKQRIAIARAILKQPKVLLLDEATSALDAESEIVVQEALNKSTLARTTIVIAHRLSTIRNANKIAILRNGAVAEQGSYEELFCKRPAAVSSTA